jgi:hypothetical protein
VYCVEQLCIPKILPCSSTRSCCSVVFWKCSLNLTYIFQFYINVAGSISRSVKCLMNLPSSYIEEHTRFYV